MNMVTALIKHFSINIFSAQIRPHEDGYVAGDQAILIFAAKNGKLAGPVAECESQCSSPSVIVGVWR